MSTTARAPFAVLTLAAAIAALAPSAALADTDVFLGRFNGDVIARGDAGDDFIYVAREGGQILIRNTQDVVSARGECETLTRHVAACTPSPGYHVNVGGGGGDDHVTAARGNLPQNRGMFLFGGAGDDILLGGPGFNTIGGGAGDDRLNGAGGEDTISGDGGADIMLGGDANDIIDATLGSVINNPRRDPDRRIDCGDDQDTYYADREDPRLRNCETEGL